MTTNFNCRASFPGIVFLSLITFLLLPACGHPTESSSPTKDASGCVRIPETNEGPYYIHNDLMRTDIRDERKGIDVALKLRIVDAGTCQPIRNAVVAVWHCDGSGYYSGYPDQNPIPAIQKN